MSNKNQLMHQWTNGTPRDFTKGTLMIVLPIFAAAGLIVAFVQLTGIK
jgi:hypothetical protein